MEQNEKYRLISSTLANRMRLVSIGVRSLESCRRKKVIYNFSVPMYTRKRRAEFFLSRSYLTNAFPLSETKLICKYCKVYIGGRRKLGEKSFRCVFKRNFIAPGFFFLQINFRVFVDVKFCFANCSCSLEMK